MQHHAGASGPIVLGQILIEPPLHRRPVLAPPNRRTHGVESHDVPRAIPGRSGRATLREIEALDAGDIAETSTASAEVAVIARRPAGAIRPAAGLVLLIRGDRPG